MPRPSHRNQNLGSSLRNMGRQTADPVSTHNATQSGTRKRWPPQPCTPLFCYELLMLTPCAKREVGQSALATQNIRPWQWPPRAPMQRHSKLCDRDSREIQSLTMK